MNKLSDEEIVSMVQSGDLSRQDELLDRYKNTVKIKARSYFLIGADQEDLIQEGMIGLYNAICDFKPNMDASFSTFADLCITRKILTSIKNANRKKHSPLNSYVSFNRSIDDEDGIVSYIDVLSSEMNDSDPEKLYIQREELSFITNSLNGRLSKLERDCMMLYLNGLSYSQIAESLVKDFKAIDNALQRVRRKLDGIISEK